MSTKLDKRRKRRTKDRKPIFLILMLGGGLLLAAALALALGKGEAPGSKVPVEVRGAPNLVVDQEKVDLGPVKLGEWVNVEFQVANNGDQPLQFQRPPYVSVVEGC
jgi:hypothetical protein